MKLIQYEAITKRTKMNESEQTFKITRKLKNQEGKINKEWTLFANKSPIGEMSVSAERENVHGQNLAVLMKKFRFELDRDLVDNLLNFKVDYSKNRLDTYNKDVGVIPVVDLLNKISKDNNLNLIFQK